MRPAVGALLSLPFLILIPGCASGPAEIEAISPGAPNWHLLRGRASLPEGRYRPTNCGPETLCAALVYLGIPATITDVESETYIPSIKGSVPPRIVSCARRKGAHARVSEGGNVWKLMQHIDEGSPVIIEVSRRGQYHYYLVVGVNPVERVIACAHYGNLQHQLPFDLLDEIWKAAHYRFIAFTVAKAEQLAQEGWDFLDAGKNEEAEKSFLNALKLQADEGKALSGLGKIRLLQGKLEEAQGFLERALKSIPGDPEALNNLAETILQRKGDIARANTLTEECVAGQLRRIKEFDEELAAAPPGTQEAIKRDIEKARVNLFYYYGTRAQALEANGRLKESIEARLESLKYPHLEEDDPDAPARRHLEIGLTWKALGAPDKAAEYFRKALELTKDENFRKRIREATGQ